MATRTEPRPMSPFARARASAGVDITTDLRATIEKIDVFILDQEAHIKLLQERIAILNTELTTKLSGLKKTYSSLERRVTLLETQISFRPISPE